ncbi:3-isopropylmalate dehydrogenase [Geomicrobium sp. JCM 19037]|uniref:3-isopropylmalate dehydrogenase n=1 Tax=unclassified Geomicrobium TaxID=2628951 RepID=UPI00045F10C8|nr:3-isopropylmalate dehydrogenase [Geomicrobium sp. JCM 19037]GAK03165.1 3-isopropylmalate dehydrogenase [Geomicrobium sp. JCM 19037]
MSVKKIAVLPGDGIGPEVTEAAVAVLQTVAKKRDHQFEFSYGSIGGAAIDETGDPFPKQTEELCKGSDAILLGAVGGPKWDGIDVAKRPEKGLLKMRKELGLFANLRPVKAYAPLLDSSPLKREVVKDVDVLIVRELTGGIYFGDHERKEDNGEVYAVDTLTYSVSEIDRITERAIDAAALRSKRIVSVDKANVLESSRLWREVVEERVANHPDISLSHMLVDNAAMQLIQNPSSFDVILTENMFGDILSDEASMLTGSLGLLPSASLGETGPGVFEPIHGSAPDIAGLELANPLAAISSAAMLLKYGFGFAEEAEQVERAILSVLEQGYRTKDLQRNETKAHTTKEMTEAVIQALA